MKKSILIMSITAFVAGTMFTSSCQSSEKKTENTQEKIEVTNNSSEETPSDLNKKDSTDYQKFKKASEVRINNYEMKIADSRSH